MLAFFSKYKAYGSHGPDWILHAVSNMPAGQHLYFFMLLWRIWHTRNEVVHHKPAPSTEASKRFLQSYVQSLLAPEQSPDKDPIKGKAVVLECGPSLSALSSNSEVHTASWKRPDDQWVKINTDGSYVAADGTAGSGMVLRDHSGDIIFTVCRRLLHCHGVLEAELCAIREGFLLALQWTDLYLCCHWV